MNAVYEEWKPVEGYEGLYEVSNLGNVKSLYGKTRICDKANCIMRKKFDNRGYYRVNLHKDGKCKAELLSRIIAKAFIPNPENLPMVGHFDDNKLNNSVENLYWTNAAENNRHNGKLEKFHEAHRKNIDVIRKKLSIKVVGTSIDGTERITFDSMQQAKRVGFDVGKISMCINRKRNSHKGYIWERG